MSSTYGEQTVVAEMPSGKLRHLPVRWTSLYPRQDPLMIQGKEVLLDPGALRDLVGWVKCHLSQLKNKDQELATAMGGSDNQEDGIDHKRRDDPAAVVVGKDRTSAPGCRVSKRKGGMP